MSRLTYSLISVLMLTLAACGSPSPTSTPSGDNGASDTTSNNQQAARVVEAYLQAKVASDYDGVRANLCAAMEADLDREAFSFSGVSAEIENMMCAVDAGGQTVTCAGQIAALYGGDTRFFELSTYNVVQEDGVWKWCGETAAALEPTPTPE
jgi:hypothetical protein